MSMYLLDTHILLWWLSDDKKLSGRVRSVISDPDNHVWVSAVSVWEVIIKKSLKKLKAPDNLLESLESNNFELLSMTVDHAIYLEHLPLIHHDPFDRLLIAQCVVEDLVLITNDKIMPKYRVNCYQ